MGTGPNVNNESNDTPDGCTVEQVAYVVRHGSRYPDTGAYNEWVALHTKVSLQLVYLGCKIEEMVADRE